MSSTNRSAAREKHISDFYITPLQTIRDFMSALTLDAPSELVDGFGVPVMTKRPLQILDPCAGGDERNVMAYPNALRNYSGWEINDITTIDVREDSKAEFKADYLNFDISGNAPFDMVITNPPFNIAMAVIEKSLRDVQDYGLVIMLLRLNFFGSKERQSFFQNNMPVLTYVHTKRPKFLNTGGTDSVEYMHSIWQKGNPCRFTKMRII